MGDGLFRNRYRIASARADWHDYNGGIYFITICTADRNHYLGEIENGEMNLSAIGRFVTHIIEQTPAHNPYAEIPLFVVMPNHIHAIVCIDGDIRSRDVACRVCTDFACRVCTDRECHDGMDIRRDVACRVSTCENPQMQAIAYRQGLLSVCIGGIKSAVTKYANAHSIAFKWQTRFHDHIIRDVNEMNRIADYIETNVARWEMDCFHAKDSPQKSKLQVFE